MKLKTILACILFCCNSLCAQVSLDLSIKKGSTQTIPIKEKEIHLINCSKQFRYKVDWSFVQLTTPFFELPTNGVAASKYRSCGNRFQDIIEGLSAKSEDTVRKYVALGKKMILELGTEKKFGDCIQALMEAIALTEISIPIPYVPLKNNQVITLTVTKIDTSGNQVGDNKWTFILKTPEQSRWLVHYGLTYTPSVISKATHYYSLADTSAANKFTITRENNNGPKPWENISATINFTYPFHGDSRSVDGGFTAGFGLSAGLELSGQAGLSLIVGDNVILSSGFVMMQKYKLMGKYKEGQIIKENLDFNSLHQKMWLPELYFTLGFRFGKNPFEKKSSETSSSGDKPEPTAKD